MITLCPDCSLCTTCHKGIYDELKELNECRTAAMTLHAFVAGLSLKTHRLNCSTYLFSPDRLEHCDCGVSEAQELEQEYRRLLRLESPPAWEQWRVR